jgi:carboxyl-terminal processing protease
MQFKRVGGDTKTLYGRHHSIGKVLVLAAVFLLGIFIGSGRIHLGGAGQFKGQTGLPSNLDYASVNQVYQVLRQNYNGKLSESQILDGLKHGVATATGDPYTEYFSSKEAKAFNGELQGVSLTGVGAQLELDTAGNVVVVAPLEGSPATAAGLRAKDVITAINGQSTSGMSANDAVTKIRGPKGTKVTLGILRGGDQQLTFTITRDTINVPTATSKILDNNIGYIQVSQFSSGTFSLVQQAVGKFQQAGVKKLVLDLRDDPGGEVDTAKNIASLWLPDNALIMQEKRGTTVVDSYRATGTNPFKGMPTVVLVNAGSASASEITALALHDNKAATIIGVKSYGKGVVQQVIPFSDGSELKVTIANWYAPNGESINKKGISPDTTVQRTDDDYKAGNDPQLQAAQDLLQTK